jgi:hypothetical protein
MTAKMTVLYRRWKTAPAGQDEPKSGNVVGVLTRTSNPDSVLDPKQLAGEDEESGVRVHDPSSYSTSFAVPRRLLRTHTVDFDEKVFLRPARYALQDGALLGVTAPAAAMVTSVPAAGQLSITISGAAGALEVDTKVWARLRNQATGVEEPPQEATTQVVGANIGVTIPFLVPAATYDFVVLIAGYQPVFNTVAVP